MSKYPSVTLRVQIEGQDALVLGPLDDAGNGFALCPGDEERGLVLAALADALGIVAGTRPGPMPTFAVYTEEELKRAKGRPKLSLVKTDEPGS